MVMEIRGMFYVYVDYREDDGKPFYVGKGNDDRVKDLNRNQLHTNIKNKHGMFRKVVFETLSEQDAFDKEVQLIQELKTHIDFDEGGANFTLGGEGTSGCKHTDEQRKKLEIIKNDPDYRKNISEKTKKIWEDPKQKSIRKASCKKAWEDPELRKTLSDSLKKTYEDPVLRREVSERFKELWDDPEYKESTRESIKKAVNKPEFKKRSREITKKQWEDPDARDLKIRKMKEAHSKRTPEQKKEHLKKCWETRRLNKLKKEAEGKDSN